MCHLEEGAILLVLVSCLCCFFFFITILACLMLEMLKRNSLLKKLKVRTWCSGDGFPC